MVEPSVLAEHFQYRAQGFLNIMAVLAGVARSQDASMTWPGPWRAGPSRGSLAAGGSAGQGAKHRTVADGEWEFRVLAVRAVRMVSYNKKSFLKAL